MTPLDYTYHQITFCGALSVKPRSMDCSVHAPNDLKNKIKHAMYMYVATSPLPPLYTTKAAYINFGMWGRVLDVSIMPNFNSIGSGVS